MTGQTLKICRLLGLLGLAVAGGWTRLKVPTASACVICSWDGHDFWCISDGSGYTICQTSTNSCHLMEGCGD